MIDRAIFFDQVRKAPFPGAISQTQVGGCNALLDEAERRGFDSRWTAYCLATAYHETAHTMLPIAEYGRGKGKAYGEVINGRVYYGRGYVQLTWVKNYDKMGKLLKADLVGNPELALDPKIAAQVMFEGMTRGSFTGKKLADFFNGVKTDWEQARKIINGMDRAATIGSYARQFNGALIAANAPVKQPIPDIPAPVKLPPKPPAPMPPPVKTTHIAAVTLTFLVAIAAFAGEHPIAVAVVIALVIGGVVLWRKGKK